MFLCLLWPRTHCKFQEWQPHLNAEVSLVNYRSMCVRNSTHSHICNHSNICRLAGVNKFLAVRYVPFLLSKDCFCPLIWTKSWPLLPLIDVRCCVYAREAALESAVLLGCHVLIYKRFQACCLVIAHKDRHFMELIKWSVADMRYINFYFGVIKQSIFFLCLSLFIVFSCEDLATLTLYRTAHERS